MKEGAKGKVEGGHEKGWKEGSMGCETPGGMDPEERTGCQTNPWRRKDGSLAVLLSLT